MSGDSHRRCVICHTTWVRLPAHRCAACLAVTDRIKALDADSRHGGRLPVPGQAERVERLAALAAAKKPLFGEVRR